MSSLLSGSPTSGLTSAAALLQVNLGIGFVLGAVGIASRTPAVKKQLADAPCEAALRAAAKAVSAVPALVAAALLQVRAAPDVFVSVGFLVSSIAIALAAFLAVLGHLVGGEEGAPRFVKATRVLGACRAFGQMLLVFAALPEGTSLMTASCLVRAALAAQAAAAVVGIVAPSSDSLGDILSGLESATALAPVFAAISLLNPEGAVFFQPALYALVHFGVVAAKPFAGEALAMPQKVVGGLLTASMLLTVGLLLAANFGVETSLGGVQFKWGDPLTATSVGLCVLILGTQVLDFAFAKAEAPAPPTNGVNGHHEEHDEPEETPTATEYLKMLTSPMHVLLLALVASRMTYSPFDSDDMDGLETFSFFAIAPFRYGFILAAVAAWLQVAAFAVYVVGNSGEDGIGEPPFDVTGTICWGANGGASKQIGDAVQGLTHALLEVGLLLGCIGLGPVTWAAGGACTFGALYLAAPPKGRDHMVEVVKALLTATLASGGSTFAFLETLFEQRRAAQLAAASQRAAALADSLEKETAAKGSKAKANAEQSKFKATKGGKKK